VPERWGRLSLAQLRLGTQLVHIRAHADRASVGGLSEDWAIGQALAGRGEPHEATVTRHPLPAPREAG
jgi:hypothetical protein